MARRKFMILLAVVILTGSGFYGYEQWQQHKRNAVLDGLIDSIDCTACSARKKSIGEKRAKQKEQSLLDALNADQPLEN